MLFSLLAVGALLPFAYGKSKTTSTKSSSTTLKTVTSSRTTTSASQCPTANYNCFNYRATFDDLSAAEPAVALVKVGSYDSVFFNSFNLKEYISGSTGVIPYSLPNQAIFSNETELTTGIAALTASYTSSTISFINLYQIYIGCNLATEESAAAVPTACNFTFTAFDIHGTQVATQDAAFTPTGLLQSTMLQVNLTTAFQQSNAYSITLAVSDPLLNVGVIDSVRYVVCGNGSANGNS